MLFGGQSVIPQKLTNAGFVFNDSDLTYSLDKMIRK